MKPFWKLNYVQLALPVAVIVVGLASPTRVWASSEASERSPIVSNSQIECLLQRVLTAPCQLRRQGAPRRRVGGGSRYVDTSLEPQRLF